MFKKYKKQLIISSIIILLPIVFGLVMWNELPDSLTTHWGVEGQADGWSSKGFAIFFMPLFLMAMQFFCVWITDLTNRGKNQSPKVMNLIFWIMPVLSLVNSCVLYGIALGKQWEVSSAMPIFLGLLFTVIGNYLPKCTQNTTIGIKVVWALNNEENWNATHRFAGKLWVAAGLLTVLSALLPANLGYPIMFISLIGAGAGAAVYSYLYYRKQLKAGTAIPTKDVPVNKSTRIIRRVVWVLAIVLLLGLGCMMFTGSIEYTFQEYALVMDSAFYSPITLRYETIDSIEIRDGSIDGSRISGYGSLHLLLGFFENEEFGTYIRYTYYRCESCIIVTSKGNTLVFGGKDAAETQALYQELLSRTGK